MDLVESLSQLQFSRLLMLSAVVFVAAIVRGFSGFGFGAILLSGGSFILDPLALVPISLALEIAASVHMLPSVWPHINWRAVAWMSVASLITVSVAQHLLVALPVEPARIVIAVLIILLAITTWRGMRLPADRPRTVFGTAGLLSGAVNGVAAIGGIVAILALLATGTAHTVVRATTSIYLMVADIGAISASYLTGADLYSSPVWWRVAFLIPALVLGVWVGTRQFNIASEQTWRRIALFGPIFLSVAMLVRIAAGMLIE